MAYINISGPLKLTIEHLGAAPMLFPGVIGSSSGGIFAGTDDMEVFATPRWDESGARDFAGSNYFMAGADAPPPPQVKDTTVPIVPIVLAAAAWFAWRSLRGK